MRYFAIAASGGETADAADGVSERQARRESIAGSEWRHVIFPHIPSRGGECGEQASGKNPSRLQRVEAENIAEIVFVEAPVIDDVEDLCADDAAKNDENAEVPSLFAVVAEPLRVAHADP